VTVSGGAARLADKVIRQLRNPFIVVIDADRAGLL